MKEIIVRIASVIVTKLLESFLTPELVEKYSDKLLDVARSAIEKTENEYDDVLLPLIDFLDEVIGE